MKFTKMQGLGNDYIYLYCPEGAPENPAGLSVRMSDRHFGVGSDGLVLILPTEKADFEMRMFNADGSEAQMCGNAARCVGKYLFDRGMLNGKRDMTLKTGSGIRDISITGVKDGKAETVRVDMGAPVLEGERIPTKLPGNPVLKAPLTVEDRTFEVTCVSMGNPHAVVFVEDADRFDVRYWGSRMETLPVFPERVNVEFTTVKDREHLRMRVWERGSGETMACGTGACATLTAAVLNGLSERSAALELNGGTLRIIWDEKTGHILQEGPAVSVFEGEWD